MRSPARGIDRLDKSSIANLRQAFGGSGFSSLKERSLAFVRFSSVSMKKRARCSMAHHKYAGHVAPHLSSPRSALFAKRASALQHGPGLLQQPPRLSARECSIG